MLITTHKIFFEILKFWPTQGLWSATHLSKIGKMGSGKMVFFGQPIFCLDRWERWVYAKDGKDGFERWERWVLRRQFFSRVHVFLEGGRATSVPKNWYRVSKFWYQVLIGTEVALHPFTA